MSFTCMSHTHTHTCVALLLLKILQNWCWHSEAELQHVRESHRRFNRNDRCFARNKFIDLLLVTFCEIANEKNIVCKSEKGYAIPSCAYLNSQCTQIVFYELNIFILPAFSLYYFVRLYGVLRCVGFMDFILIRMKIKFKKNAIGSARAEAAVPTYK